MRKVIQNVVSKCASSALMVYTAMSYLPVYAGDPGPGGVGDESSDGGGQVASKAGNNTFFGDLQGKNDIMSDVGGTTYGTGGDCMNSIGDTSYFSGGQVIQKVGNSYYVNGKVYKFGIFIPDRSKNF